MGWQKDACLRHSGSSYVLMWCANYEYVIVTVFCFMYCTYVHFSKSLLCSYSVVTDWLRNKMYIYTVYFPGLEVNTEHVSRNESLYDGRFEHLKMSGHTF